MTVLSSYAESTYKETLVDPAEFAVDQGSPVLAPVKEVPEITDHKESSSRPRPEVSRLIQHASDLIELSRPEVTEHEEASSRQQPKVTEHKELSSRPRPEVSRLKQQVSDPIKLSRPTLENTDAFIPGAWNIPQPAAPIVKEMARRESGHSSPGTKSTSPKTNHASSSIPKEKPPNTTDTEAWSRLSFKGIEDFAEEVKEVALLVRRDEEFIATSLARRKQMDYRDQEEIDHRIDRIDGHTPAKFVRDAVAEGADPSRLAQGLGLSRTLTQAIRTSNNECLFALLKYGSDPNAKVIRTYGPKPEDHTALTYAAWRGNERAVWALYAAGANINPPREDIYCPRCADKLNHHIYVCSTPLLLALVPGGSESENPKFARIVRFLLANGADPNDAGCHKFSSDHLLNPPLSAAIVDPRLSNEKAASFVKLLIKAGAKTQFNHLPAASYSDYSLNPIANAVRSGNSGILSMIIPGVKEAKLEMWKHVIVDILSDKEDKTVSILMSKTYFQVGYLHLLVATYLRSFSMSWSKFSRVAILLIGKGANPTEQVSFTYTKRHILKNRIVTEHVSAIELAERIHTKMARRDTIDLLQYPHFKPGN